jgi:hypothetical protein
MYGRGNNTACREQSALQWHQHSPAAPEPNISELLYDAMYLHIRSALAQCQLEQHIRPGAD